MSADPIGRASALLLERAAEAEQDGYGSGFPDRPWCPAWTYTVVRHVERNMDIDCLDHTEGTDREHECNRWGRYAGPHVAALTPRVSVVLAGLLTAIEQGDCPATKVIADGLARAYLGES